MLFKCARTRSPSLMKPCPNDYKNECGFMMFLLTFQEDTSHYIFHFFAPKHQHLMNKEPPDIVLDVISPNTKSICDCGGQPKMGMILVGTGRTLDLNINATNTTYVCHYNTLGSVWYGARFANKMQWQIRQKRRNANHLGKESYVDTKPFWISMRR